MAINTRTEYALRALLEMVESADKPLSAMEICRRQSLPKKYIEHLLSGLKNAGFISSIAGSRGGYILAKAADKIGLYDIMQSVEDNTWDLSCNIKSNKHCLGADCELHSVWDSVAGELTHVLQSYSLQRIYEIKKKRGSL